MTTTTERHKPLALVALIIAGEAVFSLPFHIVRFFRPTFLDVFQVSNLEIGQAQGTYGVIAMACYFLGGPLADRFDARHLLLASLLATAAGGLVLAQIPGPGSLQLLYGFWGCSTILLFWSALIKATRVWGGQTEQGRAFGLLEAGRGAFAALLASTAAFGLGVLLPDDPAALDPAHQRAALQGIIYLYTGATAIAAVLVWLWVPTTRGSGPMAITATPASGRIRAVLGNRMIWPQVVIVVSAYVSYKGVDNYVLYAVQGYGLSEAEGAGIAASSAWLRPLSAIAAGFLADRIRPSRVVLGSFGILLAGYALFAVLVPGPDLYWVLVANIVFTSVAVYALRAIYFALLAESRMLLGITGTAIGIISVIGFTPDIFFAPAMGWALENHDPVTGHQFVFSGLLALACLGFASSLFFIYGLRERGQDCRHRRSQV
ncbi:MFS transporter [Seongchinamella sediminis]|uniref:MFS transporter n=1 Tax=Seongchinamella sediminis TaxID=2283635 RepID=A0A3L7E249_9GAMM|nr:MFS transporter [Seongchinamella sediminis]RLQ23079.1 MFS transporter [Seongchinamella sediminis]